MTTNILITGKLHQDAISAFEQNPDFHLTYLPDRPFEEFKSALESAQVLITRSETAVDKRLMDDASKLKMVARAAVGVGNIDLDYATEKGILVMNTPGRNTNSAAELTLGLMLSILRRIPQAQQTMKSGGWDRHKFTGNELRGKRVGLVGLGNVGHRVAKFCLGFDAEVFAFDPYISPKVFAKHGVTSVGNLVELAEKVDILSVHVPKNTETTGMVTAEVLTALGPQGLYVNAARGGIADESLLLNYLNQGKIAGAALDTFDNEPEPLAELVNHENVWCSPHIGASTIEAQLAIGMTVYEQVVKAVEGAVVDYHINLPDVGVIDKPVLKSYSTLAEKLGSVVGQVLGFNPTEFLLQYRGDISELDNSIIRLSFMKGYADHVIDGFVSFVNVNKEFEKLGIQVSETTDPSFTSYKSALKVTIKGSNNESLTIGGVVFEEKHLRMTLLNDFYFEVEPRGRFLLVENDDTPGVIGNIGIGLANANVNISSFNLSRNKQGGKAMAILGVDNAMGPEDIKKIASIPHVIRAKAIRL